MDFCVYTSDDVYGNTVVKNLSVHVWMYTRHVRLAGISEELLGVDSLLPLWYPRTEFRLSAQVGLSGFPGQSLLFVCFSPVECLGILFYWLVKIVCRLCSPLVVFQGK